MTRLLVDSSVLIKWFHTAGESQVREARAIRAAHVRGDVRAHVIDLAYYEVGNVLVRALGWTAADVADQLDDLRVVVGEPLGLSPPLLRLAAGLATGEGLSFYDAAWAAAARGWQLTLVSADRRLVDAGLAESPTTTVGRLHLV